MDSGTLVPKVFRFILIVVRKMLRIFLNIQTGRMSKRKKIVGR